MVPLVIGLHLSIYARRSVLQGRTFIVVVGMLVISMLGGKNLVISCWVSCLFGSDLRKESMIIPVLNNYLIDVSFDAVRNILAVFNVYLFFLIYRLIHLKDSEELESYFIESVCSCIIVYRIYIKYIIEKI